MPSTSENGVFISLPGVGIRPSACSSWSSPVPMNRSATQPFSLSRPFQA